MNTENVVIIIIIKNKIRNHVITLNRIKFYYIKRRGVVVQSSFITIARFGDLNDFGLKRREECCVANERIGQAKVGKLICDEIWKKIASPARRILAQAARTRVEAALSAQAVPCVPTKSAK